MPLFAQVYKWVLAAMRSLAVIPVATSVLRTELLQLRQERDEPFRTFTARVRGIAETCVFTTKCECGKSVDYTDHVDSSMGYLTQTSAAR